MTHSLTIQRIEHAHRFLPSCSCGWTGVNRRQPQRAADLYRRHVNGQQRAAIAVRKGTLISPRRPTAPELLPAALR